LPTPAAFELDARQLRMAIIDGTGPWSDQEYARAMQHSFCRQLADQLGAHARYERGPSGEGYRIRERAQRAADHLLAQHRQYPKAPLALAGYSRGGSAAVMAAAMLKAAGCRVDLLLLFDPVARHLSGDSDCIPGSVRQAWVARRRIGAPEMDRYDFSLLGDAAGHNPVRNWFGTTATTHEQGVDLQDATFLGSHGALGGVGWPHVREDPLCQQHVAEFFNLALLQAKVPAQLKSWPPV
jgi:pimeloyl-ACP methyl ester carboxylesterase